MSKSRCFLQEIHDTNMSFNPKWLDAAKILAVSPADHVLCPECGKSILQVTDVRSEKISDVIERFLKCPSCNAWTAMRLNRPSREPHKPAHAGASRTGVTGVLATQETAAAIEFADKAAKAAAEMRQGKPPASQP